MTKVQIAQNKQFLLLPRRFQLYSVIVPTRDLLYFLVDFFKVVCCRFVVFGNWLILACSDIPNYRCILTHMHKKTFENIVTNGEIAQLYSIIILSFCRDFPCSIPSCGTSVMASALGQSTFTSIVLVCLPRDHE